MKIRDIDFYYFSGTGNTLLAVRKMREVFDRQGVTVRLFRMENADPADINVDHAIGVGFPVAGQGTYPFVWDFIRQLPPAEGTPIFLVDTLLAFSGGVVGPVKKIAAAKGYTPIGAREIRMPSNLFPGKIPPEKTARKVQRGLWAAEEYANDILAGRSKWRRFPVLSDLMSLFSQSEVAWRLLRRIYPLKIDIARCTRCGLCVRLCPADNIAMNEFPEFRARCAICMRCVSFCPTEAIFTPRKKHARYRAVESGELLTDA